MDILIIGGTGQISRAISRLLAARGDRVTHYNRGQTLAELPQSITHIRGDRRDYEHFELQMAEVGVFDCVIDMVAFTSDDARSAVRAFSGRCGQYIFCSTAAVYQRPASRYPILEDEHRLPSSPYGKGKAQCEQIFLDAHQGGDLMVTILRPANTYGPGGDLPYTLGWGNYFLDRIRKGKPLIVAGDGSTLRAFCHANDVATGFVNAIVNPKAYGNAYHLTAEEWLIWDRYFGLIAQAMDLPLPELVHIPSQVLYAMAPERAAEVIRNYQFNNIFDNSRARRDLSFRYTVPFSQGVRGTIAWLDQHGRINNSAEDPLEDQVIAAWKHLLAANLPRLQA